MVVVARYLMTLARTTMKAAVVHPLIISASCLFEDSLYSKNIWYHELVV